MAIGQRLRFEILKRDKFRCRYCGATATASQLHVDHVTPVSHGGSDVASNLVTACRACNSGKSNVPLGRVSADAASVDERLAEKVFWLRVEVERDRDIDIGRQFVESDYLGEAFPLGLPEGFT